MLHGNAIIGQSGGPTSVINASLCGIIQAMPAAKGHRQDAGNAVRHRRVHAGRRDRPGPRSPGDDREPPHDAQLGVGKLPPQAARTPTSRASWKCSSRHDIRYCFLIGGNDTMDTIHRVEAVLPGAGLRTDRRGRAEDGRQRSVRHRPHARLRQRGPLRGPVGQAGRRARPRHEIRRSVRDLPDGGPFGRLAAGGRRAGQGGGRRRPAHHPAAGAGLRSRPLPGRREALLRSLRLVQHRLRRGRLLCRRHADQRLDRSPTSSPTSSSARWAAPARR